MPYAARQPWLLRWKRCARRWRPSLQPWILSRYGLYIPIAPPVVRDWLVLGAVVATGLAAGFIPAWRGYRYSVADGMIVQT